MGAVKLLPPRTQRKQNLFFKDFIFFVEFLALILVIFKDFKAR